MRGSLFVLCAVVLSGALACDEEFAEQIALAQIVCALNDSCPAPAPRPNVLLVVIDDLGPDLTSAYGEHPRETWMPNLEILALEGIRFENAYLASVCGPSRAMLMVGARGTITGSGANPIGEHDALTFGVDAHGLAKVAGRNGYRTGAFGKLHLRTMNPLEGWLDPTYVHTVLGFDHYAGWPGNFRPSQDGTDYYGFIKYTNGVESWSTTYATEDVTNDAIAFMQAAHAAGEPFFAWVGYHAVHTPYHVPPPGTTMMRVDANSAGWRLARAMAQSLDHYLGLLRAATPPGTEIYVLSDNGTSKYAKRPPQRPRNWKSFPYHGGVRVPFIRAGAGIAASLRGTTQAALIAPEDYHATLTETFEGVADTWGGGQSLSACFTGACTGRPVVYIEREKPYGVMPGEIGKQEQTVFDGRYSLTRENSGLWGFWDLANDPLQENDLYLATKTPAEQAAFDALQAIAVANEL